MKGDNVESWYGDFAISQNAESIIACLILGMVIPVSIQSPQGGACWGLLCCAASFHMP